MYIQPIRSYRCNSNLKTKIARKAEPQEDQPNFKGFKGLLKGGAIGAGVTAAGVTLVAGAVAVPAFLSYIALNGILGAISGHMFESDMKDSQKNKEK